MKGKKDKRCELCAWFVQYSSNYPRTADWDGVCTWQNAYEDVDKDSYCIHFLKSKEV